MYGMKDGCFFFVSFSSVVCAFLSCYYSVTFTCDGYSIFDAVADITSTNILDLAVSDNFFNTVDKRSTSYCLLLIIDLRLDWATSRAFQS